MRKRMKRTMTARAFGLVLSVLLPMTASAQRVLTLDSWPGTRKATDRRALLGNKYAGR